MLQDIDSQNIRKLFWFPSCGDVLDRLRSECVAPIRSGVQNLRQIDLDEMGSGRWFTRGNSIDRQPVYSPTEKYFVFIHWKRKLDLLQITIETGAVRRITEDAADDWDP